MLQIYKASAGSGKTHTLTKEYLFLAFEQPLKFISVLAVTFTNKAAAEMKERILTELQTLASDPVNSPFLSLLSSKYNISTDKIKNRASDVLTKILHNYSAFNISTIDSFVQKIIRSFTFELHLPASFYLELDLDKVSQNIAAELLQKINDFPKLKNWLTQFAFYKIDNNRKWDFRADILNFSKQLFSENFSLTFDNISETPETYYKKIDTLITICDNTISNYRKKIEPFIDKAINIINNTAINDVNAAKVKDLVNFFKKNHNNPYLELKVGKRLQKALDENNFWAKNAKKDKEKWHKTITQLSDILNNIISIKDKNEKHFRSAYIIKRNIYNLGIIMFLYSLMIEYRKNNNTLLISDLNLFLHKILDNPNNDAPFIYEKIGTKLQNFMIDEFQDTSHFQWHNFRPLIMNSLAYGKKNLIVGDVKQSIYRFRNSDWRLLHSRLKKDIPPQLLTETSLDTNWRSKKNIVHFNNALFSDLPALMHSAALNKAGTEPEGFKNIINNIYADVTQNIASKNKNGGYVQFTFFQNSTEYVQEVTKQIAELIDNLLNEGFSAGDIGILVRTKSQGNAILQYLLDFQNSNDNNKKYNVLSDESLLLINSMAVCLIVAALRLVKDNNNLSAAFEASTKYLNINNLPTSKHQNFIKKEIKDFKDILPSDFVDQLDELKKYELFELTEKIISLFKLNEFKAEISFIRSFQEIVLNFTNTNGSDLNAFLEFWNENSDKQSVQISEVKDAVKIMTIHKSKGLAFRIVIMPFCDWKNSSSDTLIWAKTEGTPFDIFPYIPLDAHKSLIDSDFAENYATEIFLQHIDSLNILYVGLTRAQERIYAFSKINKKSTGSTISDLIYQTLITNNHLKNYFDNENLIFSYGEKISPQNQISETTNNFVSDFYPSVQWSNKIDIITHNDEIIAEITENRQKAIKHGILLHSILSKISSFDDLDNILNKFVLQNKISISDAKEYKKTITEAVDLQNVKEWLSVKNQNYREREILTKNGLTKIPDRVIIYPDKIVVIDYKFGEKRSEHKKQISEYRTLLQEIYPKKNIEAYLLYFAPAELVKLA